MSLGVRLRRTKIVCTIGPSTESPAKLRAIIEAGADVLRLNYSHGTPEEHSGTIRSIRAIAAELGRPVAILQDLPGPKIRVGTFHGGSVELRAGDSFTLTTEHVEGDARRVSVNYRKLANEVCPGETILLADGNVELKIQSVMPPDIHCQVLSGGVVSNHKGVNIPQGALSVGAFTERDQTLLLAGLEMGVDLAALSFVRSPTDIASARRFLAIRQASVPLMAKIEKPEALDALDEIVAAVDSLMVARGDLGVEIPVAEVPLVQKDIIAKSIRAAKPVVTATQMLRSMVGSPRPTRAEAADVTNAVLDGTDAVMLSEETAVGSYPVEAVRTLAQIAEKAESRLFVGRPFIPSSEKSGGTSEAIGHAACLLAYGAEAAAIVCCTRTGQTAQLVARHRPKTHIIAVSPKEETVRRLMLTWGVLPVLSEEFESTDAMIATAIELARGTGLVSPGSRVVVVGGTPSVQPGQTDFLRVSSVS
ncbi:MAG: pyruvate kinase [Terriglobia bacterium]